MPSLGVIIARFQVPELTLGHTALLAKAYEQFDKVGIFLGVGQQSLSNPLSFEQRSPMLDPWEPVFVLPLNDLPLNDQGWTQSVDEQIAQALSTLGPHNVTVVGGRESCVPTYQRHKGIHPVQIINVWRGKSGTDVRQSVYAQGGTSAEFRRGVIWQVYQSAWRKDV